MIYFLSILMLATDSLVASQICHKEIALQYSQSISDERLQMATAVAAQPQAELFSHTHYAEHSIIVFNSNKEGLSVTIDTERLHLRSVQEEDIDDYAKLFGDPEVMFEYYIGKPIAYREIKCWVMRWVERWKSNPYSGFAVFLKEKDAENLVKGTKYKFIGHVVLGFGDEPGVAETAYLFLKEYWGQGYGTESIQALIKDYAPITINEGRKIDGEPRWTIEGEPLWKVVATVRPDNPGSIRVIEKAGLLRVKEAVHPELEATRYYYEKEIGKPPSTL